MDTTRRAAEDVQHVEGVARKTQTIWRKIEHLVLLGQTAKRTSLSFQELIIYTKEMEIIEVKYRRNITFREKRKLVESSMKDNTYANVAQRVSPISNDSSQPNKYRALIEKLGPNNWPKFQEQLKKKLHSVESNKTKKNPQQTPILLLKQYLQQIPNFHLKYLDGKSTDSTNPLTNSPNRPKSTHQSKTHSNYSNQTWTSYPK